MTTAGHLPSTSCGKVCGARWQRSVVGAVPLRPQFSRACNECLSCHISSCYIYGPWKLTLGLLAPPFFGLSALQRWANRRRCLRQQECVTSVLTLRSLNALWMVDAVL